MQPIDVSTLTPEERAQLEAQLAALDAQQAPAAAPDPAVTAGPLATTPDPQPVTDTATTPPGYNGPGVGETVSHTFVDAYDNDVEVTRYGVVVATHPADPSVQGSVDRAEIAWLPQGTAVLDVDQLDAL